MYIKAAGPISVAKYMKEVLTNWSGGYYMSKDVFGQQGDFITSPEIGQIFGELVAVWLYTEWQKCGSPRPLQIIELGPGRGTMIQDVLRVLSRLGGIAKADLSVHLVEVSPFMSEAQAQRLCLKSEARTVHPDGNDPALHFRSGETVSGIPVFWYHRLEDVPDAFSVVLAHEFFDALPIHKFVKLENKWREVLIDVDNENPDERKGLRFVASKTETPMLRVFLQQLKDDEKREHIERSFEAQQLVEHLATRIEQHGGFGLFMDYGHTGDGQDTFRVSYFVFNYSSMFYFFITLFPGFQSAQTARPVAPPGLRRSDGRRRFPAPSRSGRDRPATHHIRTRRTGRISEETERRPASRAAAGRRPDARSEGRVAQRLRDVDGSDADGQPLQVHVDVPVGAQGPSEAVSGQWFRLVPDNIYQIEYYVKLCLVKNKITWAMRLNVKLRNIKLLFNILT